MEKKYFKCFRLMYETWKKIKDTELQAKYFIALCEYGLDGKTPDDPLIDALLTSAMHSIDKTDEISEQKSNYMKGNKNAVKNFEKISKQRITENNRNKQKKTHEVIRSNIEDIRSNKEDNNIIDNKLSITESKDSDTNITSNINELISELKDLTKEYGIAYENKNERNFAKHILTAKDFWEFAEWIWQSRVEFAKNILRASVVIQYWKWPCSWPMSIYQNYSEVYNKARQQQQNRTVISIPTV